MLRVTHNHRLAELTALIGGDGAQPTSENARVLADEGEFRDLRNALGDATTQLARHADMGVGVFDWLLEVWPRPRR